MNAQQLWQIFWETGAPELYLLYQSARRTEMNHVLDDTGTGSAGDRLQ